MVILIDHHIIPRTFAGHRALDGIDLEAPENRVYLPEDTQLAVDMGVSPHPGGHLDSYYDFKEVLDRIADEFPDPAERSAEVRKVQDAMRIALANGDLYTNSPGGGVDARSTNDKLRGDPIGYLGRHPDELEKIRELERRGLATGQKHLIQWSPYLGNPERERLLWEAIAADPGARITSKNRNLSGTPWASEVTSTDQISESDRTPGFTPLNPGDVPTLPGSTVPSLDWLNKPEEFRRADPLLTYGVPGLPAIDPTAHGLGPLPPSIAMPQDPLVLQFNSELGTPMSFLSDGSPVMGPVPPEHHLSPYAALAGTAAVGALLLAPHLPAWAWFAAVAGGAIAAGTSAAPAGTGNDAIGGAGGVFSTGTTPYNAFGSSRPGLNTNTSGGFPAPFGPPSTTDSKSLDQGAPASSFVDRFGNWTETSAGTMPAEASGAPLTPAPDAAQTIAPEDVRRLTRVNASNAANAFTSGAPPVPYLPSSVFDDRFGQWSAPSGDGVSQQPSRPIGVFADEPSYLIPPPIWGLENSGGMRNDAEEWFSRWIQPLVRRE